MANSGLLTAYQVVPGAGENMVGKWAESESIETWEINMGTLDCLLAM